MGLTMEILGIDGEEGPHVHVPGTLRSGESETQRSRVQVAIGCCAYI